MESRSFLDHIGSVDPPILSEDCITCLVSDNMLNPEEVRSWDCATMLFLQLPPYAISPAALIRLRSHAAMFMQSKHLNQLSNNVTTAEQIPAARPTTQRIKVTKICTNCKQPSNRSGFSLAQWKKKIGNRCVNCSRRAPYTPGIIEARHNNGSPMNPAVYARINPDGFTGNVFCRENAASKQTHLFRRILRKHISVCRIFCSDRVRRGGIFKDLH
jgi:hypothetical protein